MELLFVDPHELKPWDKNARKHPQEQIAGLCDEIVADGFRDPILVDEDMRILSGHARHEAAVALGLDSVPVVQSKGLTDKQKRSFVLAANRIASNSTWDKDLLRNELRELIELDVDVRVLGFDDEELNALMNPKTKDDTSSAVEEGRKNATGRLSYNLVFETLEEQDRWFEFVKWLKRTRKGETISGRLHEFLGTVEMDDATL